MINVRIAMSDGHEFGYKITSKGPQELGVRKVQEVAALKNFIRLVNGTDLFHLSGDDVDGDPLKFTEAFFINPAHVRTVRVHFVSNEENQ